MRSENGERGLAPPELHRCFPPLHHASCIPGAVGGTGLSYLIGKRLVGLNFNQEAREADFRCLGWQLCTTIV